MSLSKKARFEVFKRDSFTCQYCGRSAPDVVLNADHIDPKANDGSDDIINLITSCFDCNSGKSDRLLSDSTVIKKRKKQIDDLQIRREQLEMMVEWQRGLLNQKADAVNLICQLWNETTGYHFSQAGENEVRELINKFSQEEVVEAISASVKYLKAGKNGYTQQSVDIAFEKLAGICIVNRRYKDKPYIKDLYTIRAIARNNLNYVNERMVMGFLERAYLSGVSVEDMKHIAATSSSYTKFTNRIYDLME